MRDIFPLHVLCLRAIGPHGCSTEITFAPINDEGINQKTKDVMDNGDNNNNYKVEPPNLADDDDAVTSAKTTGAPSRASLLLRSFHRRSPYYSTTTATTTTAAGDNYHASSSLLSSSLEQIPMSRTPCLGPKAVRRLLANEVDLQYPLIAARYNPPTSVDNGDTDTDGDTKRNQNHHNKDNNTIIHDNNITATPLLVIQYGSPALDCLQSYIDSLVELGRMDDGRLGVHFFYEWKANVQLSHHRMEVTETITTTTTTTPVEATVTTPTPTTKRKGSKKRKRTSAAAATTLPPLPIPITTTTTSTSLIPVGSLSLHNCAISDNTINAMIESGMGYHVAVLDLSGIHGLTDDHVQRLLPACHKTLRRLSLKNCRRLTNATLQLLTATGAAPCTNLQVLDVGGCYNMALSVLVQDVLSSKSAATSQQPGAYTTASSSSSHYHLSQLVELHASGLGWTDFQLQHVAETMSTRDFTALSIGFSSYLTSNGLKQCLPLLATSLQSLALHFCTPEPSSVAAAAASRRGGDGGGTSALTAVVDNALLGFLGRNLPNLTTLDIRGNSQVTSLTGWYDGRVSANWPIQEKVFLVMARYSGVTATSLEDTKRVHPLHAAQLVCIIDGGHGAITGCGGGITRVCDS